MAYEYDMKNLIAKLSGVWVESEKKEILKELQEVYRKAKAFDEVIEVFKDSDLYTDDVIEVIQEQLDSLERADDER